MSKKDSGFQKETLAIVIFLLGTIAAASLVMGGSLSPFGGGAVGWVGKILSRSLGYGLGVSSYLIPVCCVYLFVRILFAKISAKDTAKDAVAAAGLIISFSLLFTAPAFEGVFTSHLTQNGTGGKLGELIFALTLDSVGIFGSYVIALSIISACLIFLAKTSLRSVLLKVASGAIKFLVVTSAALLKAGRVLYSLSSRLGKTVFLSTARLLKKYHDRAKSAPLREKPVKKTEPTVVVPEIKTANNTPKIVVKNKKETPLKIVKTEKDTEKQTDKQFKLPPVDLLEKPDGEKTGVDREAAYANARLIEDKLKDFGVSGEITEIKPGPVITMFEYKPAAGVRVSKIASLENDLAMSLSARSIRIISPIPGKDVVGIEVPNGESEKVCLGELLENPTFSQSGSLLTIAVGKDISGTPYYTNLATAPHLMVAGTTGSGKSVLLNSLLASLFYKAGPNRLRLLMIDPKMLEFAIYEGIPHLLHPIVTEPKKAIAALKWAVAEMENRYKLLSEKSVRNIDSYNAKIEREEGKNSAAILPYIVILIDELADLIMSAASETRDAIIRIAQKARAAGIHLVVATQRPSADVVSGLLKANIPARISFLVSSKVDSRIVLDSQGAERLLGKGDMLFLKPGTNALERIQGALITDEEREKIVEFLKSQGNPVFDRQISEAINKPEQPEDIGEDETDDMYEEALQIVREAGQVSISMLQRRMKIGYNRAATIVEIMEKRGIIGEHQGAGKAREVILPEGE